MSIQPPDRTPGTALPTLTPTPARDARDRELVELHEFADGSREVRPDDEHQTGQAPPEEVEGQDGAGTDAVAETTRGDSGGAS